MHDLFVPGRVFPNAPPVAGHRRSRSGTQKLLFWRSALPNRTHACSLSLSLWVRDARGKKSHTPDPHRIPTRTQNSKCDWVGIYGHSNVQTCSPRITRCVSAPRERNWSAASAGMWSERTMFICPFLQHFYIYTLSWQCNTLRYFIIYSAREENEKGSCAWASCFTIFQDDG